MSDERKPLDLAPIKARAEAATPGPWIVSCRELMREGETLIAHMCGQDVLGKSPNAACVGSYDQVFIAHARQDIPALIAEVERLREDLLWYGVHRPQCNVWTPFERLPCNCGWTELEAELKKGQQGQ